MIMRIMMDRVSDAFAVKVGEDRNRSGIVIDRPRKILTFVCGLYVYVQ